MHRRSLAVLTLLTALARRTGVAALATRLGGRLGWAASLAPGREGPAFRGRERADADVAFFAGCVMRAAFGDTDRATVRVLRKNGCRVSVPTAQVCCGALHAHAGEGEGSRDLARRNIEAFEASGAATIVVNAAGCGAQLKAYGVLLRDDPAWRARAERFAARVRDVTEFLAANWSAVPRAAPLRVAYQDACHLAHGQKVRAQPRALLKRIPGVTLVELNDAERCCGSAGIYNLTHPDVASELGRLKANAIEIVKPDVVVTANPGCLLQISTHLERAGTRVPVRHIIDLLDQQI
jgi:glycolate oxidase iron-sulfur subunit